MKLVALLSWYDEPVADLVRCVSSLGLLGADHLVAVDGRYKAFPGATASSPPEQHKALCTAALGAGMSLTVHVPSEPWAGQEVEKRTFMHALAFAVEPDAWHFVIDADEIVDTAPDDLDQRLTLMTTEVATVMCREMGGGEAARRRLFWAQPLTVGPSHCTYRAQTGQLLSDSGQRGEVPAADLTGIVLSHRRSTRTTERLAKKDVYYRAHTEGGHLLCETGCGREATMRVRTGWRREGERWLSDPLDTCQVCGERTRMEAARNLRAMGQNPDRMEL